MNLPSLQDIIYHMNQDYLNIYILRFLPLHKISDELNFEFVLLITNFMSEQERLLQTPFKSYY